MSLQAAKNDWVRFTEKGGFQTEIILTPKNAVATYSIMGLATKHNVKLDSDGVPINGENIRITICEQSLVNANYPYRNTDNKISLFNHLASFIDSSNNQKNYIIKEVIPDETTGVITCILANYGNTTNTDQIIN